MPRAWELLGFLWERGLCKGGMPTWREGAVPGSGCRQVSGRRGARGGREADRHEQLWSPSGLHCRGHSTLTWWPMALRLHAGIFSGPLWPRQGGGTGWRSTRESPIFLVQPPLRTLIPPKWVLPLGFAPTPVPVRTHSPTFHFSL